MENYENGAERRLTPEERKVRVEKMKKKRKRRLALVVTAFCFVVILLVVPIIMFAALRVRTFNIEGQSPYTKDEIILASGVNVGKSLLFIDIEETENRIEAELPYITDVKVTKKFPATLVIRYSEAQKKFAIQVSEKSYAVISPSFRVIETTESIPDDATVITSNSPVLAVKGEYISFNGVPTSMSENGKPEYDDSLSLLMDISTAIAENNLEDINLINISSPTHIYLIYNERIVLNLGDGTNIPRKIALGKKVIDSENENSPHQMGTINLTVDMQAFFSEGTKKDIPELREYFGEEEIPTEPVTDENGDPVEESTTESEESDGEEKTTLPEAEEANASSEEKTTEKSEE